MANRNTHDMIGLGVGIVAAFLAARSQGREPTLFELLGGGLGGLAGSRAPDVLEPAIHPHHRQFAHSMTVLIGGGAGGLAVGRESHGAFARASAVETDPFARAIMQFAAGMSVGAPTGYASHLIADATTP